MAAVSVVVVSFSITSFAFDNIRIMLIPTAPVFGVFDMSIGTTHDIWLMRFRGTSPNFMFGENVQVPSGSTKAEGRTPRPVKNETHNVAISFTVWTWHRPNILLVENLFYILVCWLHCAGDNWSHKRLLCSLIFLQKNFAMSIKLSSLLLT